MRFLTCLYTLTLPTILMGCLVFMGCQHTNTANPSPPTTTPITLATWGNTAEITQLKQQLALFHQQHPGTHVTLRHIPENYLQKLHILAAAKRLPDVFLINSYHLPMFAQHGLVQDLSTFTNGHTLANTYYPTALQALSFKTNTNPNALGALPRDVSNVVMHINTTLLDTLHIPHPPRQWTMADFNATAQAICQSQRQVALPKKVYGVSFYKQPALFWLPWVWNHGGELLADNGQFALHQPNGVAGLARYLNFHTGDCPIAPRKNQIGQATPTQWFMQQRLAMMVSGRWVTPLLRQHATFTWDVWPMPRQNPTTPSITGVDATGYALAASSTQPTAGWQLIQFLTRQDAIKAVTQSGLVVPARPDVANSDAFLAPGQPPAHSAVFLDTLAHGHPTPHHPNWGAFEKHLTHTLAPYWHTTNPVSTAQLAATLSPLANTTQHKGAP